MSEPLVSVVMPNFNRAEYLAEAVDSVQRQKYQNWELIVVDDGSTDSSPELLEFFSEADKRIRYFANEKNLGIAFTRNKAIKESYGDLIAVMDSDDVMHPERIKLSLKKFKESPHIDFVYSSYLIANKDARVLEGGVVIPPTKLDFENVIRGYTAPHVTIMAKRKCFLKKPYRDRFKVNDDLALVLDWVKNRFQYKRIRKPLMVVRMHETSVSVTRDKEVKEITKELKKEFIK